MEIKTEKLVRRINELFHNLTKKEYEKITHIDMLAKEKKRWEKNQKYFNFIKLLYGSN